VAEDELWYVLLLDLVLDAFWANTSFFFLLGRAAIMIASSVVALLGLLEDGSVLKI
jgi:hypothetical protein